MLKIGMCMACGDQMSKSKTWACDGQELCPRCAEELGFDESEEVED